MSVRYPPVKPYGTDPWLASHIRLLLVILTHEPTRCHLLVCRQRYVSRHSIPYPLLNTYTFLNPSLLKLHIRQATPQASAQLSLPSVRSGPTPSGPREPRERASTSGAEQLEPPPSSLVSPPAPFGSPASAIARSIRLITTTPSRPRRLPPRCHPPPPLPPPPHPPLHRPTRQLEGQAADQVGASPYRRLRPHPPGRRP